MKFTGSIIDISPPKGVLLAGWKGIHRTAKGNKGTLEANLLLLKSNRITVILSIDTLFVSSEFKDGLLQILRLKYDINIDPTGLFIQATHTHFAPTLDQSKPDIGVMDQQYFQVVISSIAEKINCLIKEDKFTSTSVSFGRMTNNLTVNRRRAVLKRVSGKLEKFITIAPNPFGVTEPYIKTLSFRNEQKQVVAIMWNFACHPVNYHDLYNVSRDFIGDVANGLRKIHGDVPVCFVQGFAGDIRAKSLGFITRIKNLLNTILYKPNGFLMFSEKEYRLWTQHVLTVVERAMENERPLLDELIVSSHTINAPIEDVLQAEQMKGKTIDFQVISLGKSFKLIGVSLEPSAQYERYIAQMLKNECFMAGGYINSVFLYYPTDRQMKEGGYESVGFFEFFGINGQLKTGLESFFKNNIEKLLKQIK